MKKEKKEKNKKKNKRILSFCVILIILIILVCCYLFLNGNKASKFVNGKRVAVKEITEFDETKKITYELEIKNYDLVSVQKEINFNSKEEAEAESKTYETINEYEQRGIEIKVKGKTLVLKMPVSYFEYEINYKEENDITFKTDDGKERKTVNISLVKELLQEQGYTIK